MKKIEKVDLTLTLEVRRNKEFEIYKLNFMTTITIMENNKKKLITEMVSILKKFKDLQDTNAKLENSVSKFKSQLNTYNL